MKERECMAKIALDNSVNLFALNLVGLVIFISNFIANTIMMIGLWKVNRRFSKSQKLYFCLCIGDVLTAAAHLPYNILYFVYEDIVCMHFALQRFIRVFTITLNMFIMQSIVIDRYILITNKYVRTKRIVATMATNIVMALTMAVPQASINFSNYKQIAIMHMILGICLLMIIVIMIAFNYFLIMHIKKAEETTRQDTGVKGTYANKVTISVVILSIIMILCYFPSAVCNLLLGIDIHRQHSNTILIKCFSWATVLLLVNTTINSVVYVSRSTDIKNYFMNILNIRTTSNVVGNRQI